MEFVASNVAPCSDVIFAVCAPLTPVSFNESGWSMFEAFTSLRCSTFSFVADRGGVEETLVLSGYFTLCGAIAEVRGEQTLRPIAGGRVGRSRIEADEICGPLHSAGTYVHETEEHS